MNLNRNCAKFFVLLAVSSMAFWTTGCNDPGTTPPGAIAGDGDETEGTDLSEISDPEAGSALPGGDADREAGSSLGGGIAFPDSDSSSDVPDTKTEDKKE